METAVTTVINILGPSALLWCVAILLAHRIGRLYGEQAGWYNGNRGAWLSASKSLRSFITACMGSLSPHMIKMLSEHASFCKDMSNYYPPMKAIVYKFHEEGVIDLDSKSDLVFKDK